MKRKFLLGLLILLILVGAGWVTYLYFLGRWAGAFFHYTDVSHLVTNEMRDQCKKSGLRMYKYPEGELGLMGTGYSGCGIDDICSNTLLQTRLNYIEISAPPDNVMFIEVPEHTYETKYHNKRYRIEKRRKGDPECGLFNRAAAEKNYVNNSEYCLVAEEIAEFSAPQYIESSKYAEPVMESDRARLIYRGDRIRDVASNVILIEWREYRVIAKSKYGYFESPACPPAARQDIIRILYAIDDQRMPLTERD